MGDKVSELGLIHDPEKLPVDDSMIIPPLSDEEAEKVEIVRGPNIQPHPVPQPP